MNNKSFRDILEFIKGLYSGLDPVPLHAPVFLGNEKKYLENCIDTTFVSYVGKYVHQFEDQVSKFTGAKYAVAMVNGTTALQVALKLAGVGEGHEVITQALSFVATANAISHAGGVPVFVDVGRGTLGMSPDALYAWLESNSRIDQKTKRCVNKSTGKIISAIVPMHTFGHPCRIEEIVAIANAYGIQVVEDAAESLGSFYRGKHTGTFGQLGILSFNGNKTITTGGGGMIITDSEQLAKRAMHLTTTAKVSHAWEFVHDEVGYNFRLPNVNAAIGVAQMERVQEYLDNKRSLAECYSNFGTEYNYQFVSEPRNSISNFWLNSVILKSREERDAFLEYTNKNGVMTRPIWQLLSKLKMFSRCPRGELTQSKWIEDRIVNVPSGVRQSGQN